MDISKEVAKARFQYHANACSIVNVLNQLGLMSDEKAEARNKKHVMTIVNDICPRLGIDTVKAFKEES